MTEFNVEDRFPDLQPLKVAPPLGNLLGCGFRLYGSRDHDMDTDSEVKTHCFSLLYLPILALGAFRVTPAGPAWTYLGRLPAAMLGKISGGWFFLGRVPLSGLAKANNCLLFAVLLCVAGLFAWDRYTHSEGYRAGQTMAEADRLVEAGKIGEAAQRYSEVALGNTDHAPRALAKLQELVDGPLDKASVSEATAVLKAAAALRNHPRAVRGLFDRGMRLVEQHEDADPRGALALLEAVAPASRDPKALTAARQRLLERLVKNEPADAELATQLALVYESQGKLKQCEEVLKPHAQRLGAGEGARILGQIYAGRGQLDQAHALLLAYVEPRLKKIPEVEKTLKDAETRIINDLKSRRAFGFDYQRYEQVGDADKSRMINEYLLKRFEQDPTVRKVEAALGREVPVMLTCAIVTLRRAQTLPDPAARRSQLEKAEELFRAIRGVKGQDEQYELFLGRVKFWLGKQAEGRKVIEQLLAAKKRDTATLVDVSRMLREVGLVSEARALAEEAYGKATNRSQKYELALYRSTLPVDLDDGIAWLRRCDPASREVQAFLSTSLGNKAAQEGKDDEAAKHLRQAIATYATFPESYPTLNNTGNAYHALYQVTGDRNALTRATQLYEKAVRRQPSNSILISNAASSTLGVAFLEILDQPIDQKILKRESGLTLLPYLYQGQKGRDRYTGQIRKHSGLAKARDYYQQLVILAPKSAGGYRGLLTIHRSCQDLNGLRRLWDHLHDAELDLADADRKTLDDYRGKDDDKNRKELEANIKRYQELEKAHRKDRGLNFALAASLLVNNRLSLDQMGDPVDLDEAVALAEKAHAAAPSEGTQATLVNALLARASQKLARQQKAYATMASRAKRSLGTNFLIAVALSQDGDLRAAILANADVERAIGLVRDHIKQFPDEAETWAWAMLRAGDAAEADKLAQTIRKDEMGKIARSIESRLSNVSATTAFKAHWAAQIMGKAEGDLTLLKNVAKRGVPLPFDPK